jgi:hypothetical protein
MLNFTSLDEAYSQSLAGSQSKRRRRHHKEDAVESKDAVIEPYDVPSAESPPPPPPPPPLPSQTRLPSQTLNSHTPMNTYVAILVFAVFGGMVYDMRASLLDIQMSLRKMSKR